MVYKYFFLIFFEDRVNAKKRQQYIFSIKVKV